MSCYCEKYKAPGQKAGCPCDEFIHPPALQIPAGLRDLPRQIATFPEFRRAMLAGIRSFPALANWRAREEDDLGIMLLEMWAYICDNLSFYDKVIAQENFIRTAHLRPSLRKITALIGYLPRPAVAATVQLASFAEGRRTVKLPAGTAFRSTGFDEEPPQVFELEKDMAIHPLTNQWELKAVRPGVVGEDNPNSLLIVQLLALNPSMLLFLTDSGNSSQNQIIRLKTVGPYTGKDEELYTRAEFYSSLQLMGATPLQRLLLSSPTQSVSLWNVDSSPAALSEQAGRSRLILSELNRDIQAGDQVLISRNQQEFRWFRVYQVQELMLPANGGNNFNINGKDYSVNINAPVSRIILDTSVNHPARRGSGSIWTNSQRAELSVHYGLLPAATVVNEAKTSLIASDPLFFTERAERPLEDFSPGTFLLEDKNLIGERVRGEVDFDTHQLLANLGTFWPRPLSLPVRAFGNIITASRGEQVSGEILGSGDASLPNQTFKLQKKPLTYLLSPTAGNDRGVVNTLEIYVDGILWQEVENFFRSGPEDPVYIIRQNDDEESFISFGDGVRGQRLPTGADNVVANYRFGAGAAAPPAKAITQIARPVKDLQSVQNPLPASGGADAESPKELRSQAPKSALLLGRIVSMQDFEEVVLSIPGTRAVQGEWRWHRQKQGPVVHIWYIGEEGLHSLIHQRLRLLSDPSTPIQVERALPEVITLSLQVEINERYLEKDVLVALRNALTNRETGLLAPENLGIGSPLYRSEIFAAVLATEGILSVENIHWNYQPFLDFGFKPNAGQYFDIAGTLFLNGYDN